MSTFDQSTSFPARRRNIGAGVLPRLSASAHLPRSLRASAMTSAARCPGLPTTSSRIPLRMVVPGTPDELVCRGRAPRAVLVDLNRRRTFEDRRYDPPCLLDRVGSSEQRRHAVDRVLDQSLVGRLVDRLA